MSKANIEPNDCMPERRVLVFPAGTEIGLEIHAALKYCRNLRLFAAGQDVSNHARFVYPEYHPIPSVHTEGWLELLVQLCVDLEIQYIFPAHDDAILALSAARDQIPATLVTSNHEACVTTRSKRATYQRLLGKVPVPRLYASPSDVTEFPVLVKPDKGQGSSYVTLAETPDQLKTAFELVPGPLICEYLPGEEFTVDCFSSLSRGLLFAGARLRRRTRNGISMNTITLDMQEVEPLAATISRELGLRGAWFFQLKRDATGILKLLEVAPRVAGAMAAHRVAGVNFPLLSMMELEGATLQISPNNVCVELDRALHNRYAQTISFQSLYIDLDDTLIINGKINLEALKLVFQSLNEHKHVALITRHKGNLEYTLRHFRIADLFDEIIHLKENQKKSSFIIRPNAIFVDDSFSERQEVAAQHGIPTFDSSMLEMLCAP